MSVCEVSLRFASLHITPTSPFGCSRVSSYACTMNMAGEDFLNVKNARDCVDKALLELGPDVDPSVGKKLRSASKLLLDIIRRQTDVVVSGRK